MLQPPAVSVNGVAYMSTTGQLLLYVPRTRLKGPVWNMNKGFIGLK